MRNKLLMWAANLLREAADRLDGLLDVAPMEGAMADFFRGMPPSQSGPLTYADLQNVIEKIGPASYTNGPDGGKLIPEQFEGFLVPGIGLDLAYVRPDIEALTVEAVIARGLVSNEIEAGIYIAQVKALDEAIMGLPLGDRKQFLP